MSSPCLTGGGRTYGRLEIDIVKSPSMSRTSQTSSPSSTISESSNNSQLAISTRKSRTPRKRPNQTYNEAAALLSTAYPNVFSSTHLSNNARKYTKPHDFMFYESSELLPFQFIDSSSSLLHQPIHERALNSQIQPKFSNSWERPCHSPGEVIDFQANSNDAEDGYCDDFDAESILDEEIEEGIDSIMGNLCVDNSDMANGSSNHSCINGQLNSRNWNHHMSWGLVGGKFDLGLGMRTGSASAMRRVDDGNWWCSPIVDVLEISPKLKKPPSSSSNSAPTPAEKKKKKKVEKSAATESKKAELPQKENSTPTPEQGLLLKLNYEEVVNAWSDRGCPFSDECDSPGTDVSVCSSPSTMEIVVPR